MRKNLRVIIIALMGLVGIASLLPTISKMFGTDTASGSTKASVLPTLPILEKAKFNSDSAYTYTDKIVGMGPRIVGSAASDKVRAFVVDKFKLFGCDVIEQKFTAATFDGKSHNAVNIIARTNLQATKRILLSAHWDSRPFSDQDPDSTMHNKPCPGADDAATGVAELMEIARQIQANPIEGVGVDILLWDAEDYGTNKKHQSQAEEEKTENTWCLGTQYWASHPHVPGYSAIYGINLDMTGARNAHFGKEGTSMKYAPLAVDKIWRVGRFIGYSNFFADEVVGGITDDHKVVNEMAHIPCVDIVNQNLDKSKFFADYWHTQQDNMNVVDKETMRAVGQTILAVLHYESANAL